jgi:hypothetical protein
MRRPLAFPCKITGESVTVDDCFDCTLETSFIRDKDGNIRTNEAGEELRQNNCDIYATMLDESYNR